MHDVLMDQFMLANFWSCTIMIYWTFECDPFAKSSVKGFSKIVGLHNINSLYYFWKLYYISEVSASTKGLVCFIPFFFSSFCIFLAIICIAWFQTISNHYRRIISMLYHRVFTQGYFCLLKIINIIIVLTKGLPKWPHFNSSRPISK